MRAAALNFIEGRVPLTPQNRLVAEKVLDELWAERALELWGEVPLHRAGSCKFAALLAQKLFGGAIRGNLDHVFVQMTDGSVLDLNEDQPDVLEMEDKAHHHDGSVYGHDYRQSLASCLPRVEKWLEVALNRIENPFLGKTFFHGSNRLFKGFSDPQIPRGAHGNIAAIYLTSDWEAAEDYGQNVYEVKASITNPYIGCPKQLLRAHLSQPAPGFGKPAEAYKKDAELINPASIKQHLMDLGFDGVFIPAGMSYFDHDEVIALSPDQLEIISINGVAVDVELEQPEFSRTP